MNFQRTLRTSVLCRPNGPLRTLFPIRFSEQLEELADTFAQYHKRANISFARDTEWVFLLLLLTPLTLAGEGILCLMGLFTCFNKIP